MLKRLLSGTLKFIILQIYIKSLSQCDDNYRITDPQHGMANKLIECKVKAQNNLREDQL